MTDVIHIYLHCLRRMLTDPDQKWARFVDVSVMAALWIIFDWAAVVGYAIGWLLIGIGVVGISEYRYRRSQR
jgi:hypothetical protein